MTWIRAQPDCRERFSGERERKEEGGERGGGGERGEGEEAGNRGGLEGKLRGRGCAMASSFAVAGMTSGGRNLLLNSVNTSYESAGRGWRRRCCQPCGGAGYKRREAISQLRSSQEGGGIEFHPAVKLQIR